MEQKYNIELIEEYEDINFYSIHLEGEELSEFENFFEKFKNSLNLKISLRNFQKDVLTMKK